MSALKLFGGVVFIAFFLMFLVGMGLLTKAVFDMRDCPAATDAAKPAGKVLPLNSDSLMVVKISVVIFWMLFVTSIVIGIIAMA